MKATYGEVEGVGRNIFKDPITDDGTKKSLKGLITVSNVDGEYVAIDGCDWSTENTGELKEVYRDGKLTNETNLREVRNRLK